MLDWFNAREAVDAGVALADYFSGNTQSVSKKRRNVSSRRDPGRALQDLMRQTDRDQRVQRLNFYQKARFATSFKWQLLQGGVAPAIAAELTRRVVVHLSLNSGGSALGKNSPAAPISSSDSGKARYCFDQANACVAQGAHSEAVGLYQACVRLNPRHTDAINNLAATLCELGRYEEAENHFRAAISLNANHPEAHGNLGALLRSKGRLDDAEASLRRAIKLRPDFIDARCNLGSTLTALGRLRDARAHFKRALKVVPRHAGALLGLGHVARLEGRFEETGAMFKRALKANPTMPDLWASMVGQRKMTTADADWLKRAEELAAGRITPLQDADLRFAMGKYCDDVGDFPRAFDNYRRGNALLKNVAGPYERGARTRFVDDLIQAYSSQASFIPADGASDSVQPIFVVGMMRSGTSLAEQIIASHPSVKGAGELGFWNDAVREHESAVRAAPLERVRRTRLSQAYLRVLTSRVPHASRIVDKAPVNSDYLGLIHSVFPRARIIYMRRNPIDSCLSCYFQQLSPALTFTMDLSDLAHYYHEHHRLIAHWRSVLPPGTILDVPYAELVADQEGWTRKILEFLGLEWDRQCLDFHKTNRPVVTASFWQVRQKMYRESVERWRNYAQFIGPLLRLTPLAA